VFDTGQCVCVRVCVCAYVCVSKCMCERESVCVVSLYVFVFFVRVCTCVRKRESARF